jgi:hypothetical protein
MRLSAEPKQKLARQHRLADALRENLAKRKMQDRRRNHGDHPAEKPGAECSAETNAINRKA